MKLLYIYLNCKLLRFFVRKSKKITMNKNLIYVVDITKKLHQKL
jgi:hypothetical protein